MATVHLLIVLKQISTRISGPKVLDSLLRYNLLTRIKHKHKSLGLKAVNKTRKQTNIQGYLLSNLNKVINKNMNLTENTAYIKFCQELFN